MKILELVDKAQWYDMLESGEKTEEYREMTQYWINRLCEPSKKENVMNIKHYDAVRYRRGYTKTTVLFEVKDFIIGQGRKEWGAPSHPTFIIENGKKLGK